MSLNRLERMQMLVELEKQELEKAEEVLVSVRGQLEANEAQLFSLQEYHQSYVSELSSGHATNVFRFQVTHTFVEKVNRAIESQKNQVTEMEKVVEMAQSTWLEKRARHDALNKLFEKLLKDQKVRFEKLEQKMLDELSTIHFSRRHNPLD